MAFKLWCLSDCKAVSWTDQNKDYWQWMPLLRLQDWGVFFNGYHACVTRKYSDCFTTPYLSEHQNWPHTTFFIASAPKSNSAVL